MKRTTRFILVLFVAVFSLIVVGCNGQTTTQAPTTLAPTTQVPSTQAPTTHATSTVVPTTLIPTTLLPTTTGIITTEEEEVFVLLDRSTARLDVGSEITLVAEMTDMSSPTFVWTSSNPLVASVSEGVVSALTSGQTTIRVSVGTLYAECIVTVDDVIDLIFPAIPATAFVGDQIDLGAFARVNGVSVEEGIEISGAGFSNDGNLVTFTGSGIIQITVSYPGTQPITRNITVYHEVKSIADFLAIKEDLAGYYMMTADIDYAGEPLDTIAHYLDGYTSSENGFSGVFDGNGHTISNFYAYYSTNPSIVANSSPFGLIASQGVVRNTNFVGVTIKTRIAAGIATINYGLIENCFAQVYVTYETTSDHNNPMGGLVSKNYGVIRHSIAVVDVKSGISDINIGGVVGRTLNGSTITNSYSISSVGRYESGIPTNGDMLGDFTNFEGYPDVAAFYASAVLTGFSDLWQFSEGYFPHLGDITDVVEITNTLDELYAGKTLQIDATHTYPVTYQLLEAVDGVSIGANGLLSVLDTVPGGTEITVVVTSKYCASCSDEFTVTIMENNYEISATSEQLDFNWILGVSDASTHEALHGIVVLYNGELYTGEVSIVSTNELVAVIDGDKIIAVGDGTAFINVVIDQQTLFSIEINSIMYQPVTTTAEFLAIGTNLTTLSGKYLLMNDLDFGGQAIYAFSSYKTKNSPSALAFSGIFDGNNHTIANFEPHQNQLDSTDRDRSIFGYLTPSAIVKNTNFIGAIGRERTSVVANWNEGTIENIYVEMLFVSTSTSDNRTDVNAAGIVVAKNRLGATVSNCITVLEFAAGATTQYIGGVIGTNSGIASDIFTITNNATTEAIHKPYPEGTVTNAGRFADLEAFHDDADVDNFSADWVINEGFYPYLKELTDTVVITNTVDKIYVGTSLQISATSTYGLFYQLAEAVDGVSISATGVLSVQLDAVLDTMITIHVLSHFGVHQDAITLKISENNFTVTAETDSFEFDWIHGHSPVQDTEAALGITIYNNGDLYTGDYDLVISHPNVVKVEDGMVIAMGDGDATIDVQVEGQTIYTLNVQSVMYLPITTIEEFAAIGTSEQTLAQKYKLMNDLDYAGQGLPTLAHYSAGYTSNIKGFSGVFDGNGYSISNFYPYYAANPGIVANHSPFGTVALTGVIRNTNFTGVLIKTRISAGIATMNYGLIENCFVEVHVTYNTTSDVNNPMGGIASKNYGTIQNNIVVMTVQDGISTVNIGGIVGRTYEGSLNLNSMIIGPVGIYESAVPTGGMLGTITNVEAYTTLENFYLNADVTSFNEDWVFNAGFYPHLSGFSDTVDITNASDDAYPDQSVQVSVNNTHKVVFALLAPVEGISINATGLVTIADTVPLGTEFTVTVASVYDASLTDQMTFVVREFTLEVIADLDSFTFEWIIGHSLAEDYEAAHGITVMHNGVPYAGEVNFVSQDATIAVVEDGKVKALGDGTTTIDVVVNSVTLYTITVHSLMWHPVETIADFIAIGQDGMSVSKRYILMNDLDFEGEGLPTIAHYSAGYTSKTNGFSGVFDGNNHTISNFYAYYATNPAVVANSSPFGTVAETGVIRNTNFTGVLIKTRIAGGVATINYGLIENCFVEVHFTYHTTSDVNNPMGGIASKNYGTIQNCITVVTVQDDISTVNIGGVVGRTYDGSATLNSMTIGPIGIYESQTPTGGMLGTLTNVVAYSTLDAFYLDAVLDSFGEAWEFQNGYYPHLSAITDEVTIINEETEIAIDDSLAIMTTHTHTITFALLEPVSGVTISAEGLLVVDASVTAGTEITVAIQSVFDPLAVDQITLTVVEAPIEE